MGCVSRTQFITVVSCKLNVSALSRGTNIKRRTCTEEMSRTDVDRETQEVGLQCSRELARDSTYQPNDTAAT